MSSIISINLDSFIYAVRQAFDARIKKQGVFESHIKYTPFLDNTWQKPEDSNVVSLKHPLNEIVQHHWVAIPQYQRHDSVTLENIAWFALSIATLFADIEYLCKETLGYGIPSQQEESDDAKALWSLIQETVKSHFKEYAELFNLYAEWKYNPQIEKKEPVDWNVRPPCGMLYRTEFKALFDEIRNARFGNRQNQKNSHSQHRDKTDHRKTHNDQRKENPEQRSDHTEQRNENPEQRTDRRKQYDADSPRTNRAPQHRRKNDEMRDQREHGKRQRERKPQDSSNTEALQSALEACKTAIETMKNNSNTHELSLAPQNSFIRRHQHTLITDAGFDTDSRGDGNQRHVCIIKK